METWKTDDMTLVAFLTVQGHHGQVQWEGDVCYFVFDKTDNLQHWVAVYNMDEARVNPRSFSKAFGGVKRRMFDHADAPRSVGRGRRR